MPLHVSGSNQVRQERAQHLHSAAPIYLTEWNSSPSQQDLLNDTCFKFCYIVKCILENYDRLDSFAFWSLTDWMGEAPQPPQLFHGGLGLFTANGIAKASYYAFTLLRKLGDDLLSFCTTIVTTPISMRRGSVLT